MKNCCKLLILFCFVSGISCAQQKTTENSQTEIINPQGNTVKTRFNVPDGFVRRQYEENSFAAFLQNFPLKPAGSKVFYFNGNEKFLQIHAAVLDIDIGEQDLQQCADAIIRLRAEYLFKQKKYSEINFNLTNGFAVSYLRWAEGYRVKVAGNKTEWVKTAVSDNSYKTFKSYLFFVFNYAGTLSLSRQMKTKNYADLQAGDVFIRGGSPGHAMIVIDLAQNAQGKKIFLLAQSYMPAQSIHIVKNSQNLNFAAWYELNETDSTLITPEWIFKTSEFKSF
ncbi:MAG: DUF4846 domain-containing protein [Paludibacter sp.]|nr:DUF4846 domain-containing protein [Paludibacter sp.]